MGYRHPSVGGGQQRPSHLAAGSGGRKRSSDLGRHYPLQSGLGGLARGEPLVLCIIPDPHTRLRSKGRERVGCSACMVLDAVALN